MARDGTNPLFTPGRIGPLHLGNRVIMAPMTTRHADAEGFVTEEGLAYYAARAAGGVGLVTVEMAAPEPAGKHRRFELGIGDDRFLPGLKRLVRIIHEQGAKASIQLGHGGGHTRRDICGEEPVAPSAIAHSVQEGHTEIIVPQAMSEARIAACVEAFAQAAERAGKAGFDAVEIHAAHGYLVSQFLNPLENRREDRYGGPLENRARFGLDILRAVKAAVPGLAVIFRMNGDDFFQHGMTAPEAVEIARWAAQAGADAIHVTAGHYRSQPSAAIMIPPMATPPTPFLDFARAIKAVVPVPVIGVGRLGDPARAAAAIAAGAIDFVALGRPLLADPDWVANASAGDEVRRCLACNSCVDGMRTGSKLHCIVNPTTGRERAFADARSLLNGKRIAVIGAGPAGLTYAGLAALQNRVTLFERKTRPGGALRLAGLAPLYQGVAADRQSLIEHVDAALLLCRQRGVRIEMGLDPIMNPERLVGFDHIVVATGADYRGGLGPAVRAMLSTGLVRHWPLKAAASHDGLRDWFYHRAREPGGPKAAARIASLGIPVEIIGDALAPGKTRAAIASAYAAVYGRVDADTTA
nr:FAD-dependent oxidoreductase [Methylobacterium sp. ZNC0032]